MSAATRARASAAAVPQRGAPPRIAPVEPPAAPAGAAGSRGRAADDFPRSSRALSFHSGAFAVEVDLMQPLDAAKSPKVHAPPLNHIGLWVDDIHAAVDELRARGVRFAPGGVRRGASGHDVTFLHPKGNAEFPLSGEGVLIELVQAPPEVIAAFDGAA